MTGKKVSEVMIPLSEYAVVSDSATLGEAIAALDEAQKSVRGRQPHRAVLVIDRAGTVVGKIGHWGLLKALEPQYSDLAAQEELARAGVSTQQISSMLAHSTFFQDSLEDLCARAAGLPVRRVMNPVAASIHGEATLGEAMHKMVLAQTLSLLVTRAGKVIGVLRLSDLVEEALAMIRLAEAARKHQE